MNDIDKYILIGIARKENSFLMEWVDYHLSIGFDKVIIGDNNDIEDDSLNELFKDYIEKGKVEIINYRGVKMAIIPFYNMFSENGSYKWCAFFDCDEFLELNSYHQNIKEFLSEVKENCILINWMSMSNESKLFGNTDNIVYNYKKILPMYYGKIEHMTVKSIIRGGLSYRFINGNPHCPFLISDGEDIKNIGFDDVKNYNSSFYETNWKYIYLKHFRTRSLSDFNDKMYKGWGLNFAPIDYSCFLAYTHTPLKPEPIFTVFYPKIEEKKILIKQKNMSIITLIEYIKNLLINNSNKDIILCCDNITNDLFNYCYEICNSYNCRLYYIKEDDLEKFAFNDNYLILEY